MTRNLSGDRTVQKAQHTLIVWSAVVTWHCKREKTILEKMQTLRSIWKSVPLLRANHATISK